MNIGRLVAKRAAMHPNKECLKIVELGQSLTFQQHEDRVNQTANALINLGVRKGDRVGTLLLNSAEAMESLYACAKIGAILVPINWRLVKAEVAYIMKDSGLKGLIYSQAFASVIEEVLTDKELDLSVEFLLDADQNEPSLASAFSLFTLREQEETTSPDLLADGDDICLIMYTSGTTGHPKGVMHTHDSLLWAVMTMSATMQTCVNDRFLTAMPMFHVAALLPVLLGMYEGFTMCIAQKFDPNAYWQQIESEKVTVTLLAPVMMNLMIHAETKTTCDHSSLRFIMAGAAPVPVPLIQAYLDLNIEVHQVYGMTETAGPACIITGEEAMTRKGSAGKGFLLTNARVVNSSDEDVKPGEKGEVIVSGNHLMKGYWNLPEETAKVLKNGWYYSGDAGVVDEDGFIYIVDRIKDMIISGGENIYPAEIEEVLLAMQGIKEVAVVGKNDDNWGEIPVAFVVSTSDTLSALDIKSFLVDKLASYKVPKEFHFIEQLPRNMAGKILKKALKEQI